MRTRCFTQKFASCKNPLWLLTAHLHRSLAQAPKACTREPVLHDAHGTDVEASRRTHLETLCDAGRDSCALGPIGTADGIPDVRRQYTGTPYGLGGYGAI
jgi:hypothetical protein